MPYQDSNLSSLVPVLTPESTSLMCDSRLWGRRESVPGESNVLWGVKEILTNRRRIFKPSVWDGPWGQKAFPQAGWRKDISEKETTYEVNPHCYPQVLRFTSYLFTVRVLIFSIPILSHSSIHTISLSIFYVPGVPLEWTLAVQA